MVTADHYLVLSVLLTWVMIMVAAEAHTPTWTRQGARLAFGNRNQLHERSAFAQRADRAAKNMLENMVLFIGLFVAARSAGVDPKLGSAIFCGARVAYFGLYLGGVAYVRSVAWLVSVLGLLHIAYQTLYT